MAIAIYRHLKLYVAVTRQVKPVVSNFHPRRLRNVNLVTEDDGSQKISVAFTKIDRRMARVTHNEVFWEFRKEQMKVIEQVRRNGNLSMKHEHTIPRLSTVMWVENGVDKPVVEQVEAGISTLCIVEKYLHDNVANPHDYQILMVDFRPGMSQDNAFAIQTLPVRSRVLSETAARTDQSESADSWLELFEGVSP